MEAFHGLGKHDHRKVASRVLSHPMPWASPRTAAALQDESVCTAERPTVEFVLMPWPQWPTAGQRKAERGQQQSLVLK